LLSSLFFYAPITFIPYCGICGGSHRAAFKLSTCLHMLLWVSFFDFFDFVVIIVKLLARITFAL
jgi:hypothetical protein